MAYLLFFLSILLSAAVPGPVHGLNAHLHFYMHDMTGGPSPTAIQVVKGPGSGFFGNVAVIDDALTEGTTPTSQAVGRAQGTYTFASLDQTSLLMVINILLTDGPYNGSTIAVMGRDDLSQAVRELPVVGGTGQFRMAEGYVLWQTNNATTGQDTVLELDVYVTAPDHVDLSGSSNSSAISPSSSPSTPGGVHTISGSSKVFVGLQLHAWVLVASALLAYLW